LAQKIKIKKSYKLQAASRKRQAASPPPGGGGKKALNKITLDFSYGIL